ncbi:hypothetical protein [Aurantimonas coralicida]|uniref:hypothetical protein n=1 Tax=Aurantimonas coralicida TaxID=182270 RepID=UPI001E60DC3E|nr:hypothetical protein [Aurantimonas coralicida]MCD1645235.1 hypothetical protein [Aurantimonas coralicida]
MAALSTSLDKLLVTQTDLGAATPLDMRVAMIRMLKDMGFESVTIGNTAPADKKVLWWHKDIKTAKRYNAVTLSWDALTTDQWMLHILHRAFTAAGVDTGAAGSDLFPFYDISLGETRMITLTNLLSLLGGEIPAISSSATEFIIDLTQLESDVLYNFYGVIKWTVNTAGGTVNSVKLRVRNSSNTNLRFAGGDSYQGDGYTELGPFRSSTNPVIGTYAPPDVVPLNAVIVKFGSPARVAFEGCNAGAGHIIQSIAESTAAAKLHFSLPSGVTMNGKVVRH